MNKRTAALGVKPAGLLAALLVVNTLFGCTGSGSSDQALLEGAFLLGKLAVEGIGELFKEHEPSLKQRVRVRMLVHDDTVRNPLPTNSEIWLQGEKSWWIKRATESGSGTRDFGARKVWEKDTILIYPDGRAGKEISVPFTMTVAAGMKEWRDQAVIQVRISDDEVVVSGSPIEVGSGEPELRFKR